MIDPINSIPAEPLTAPAPQGIRVMTLDQLREQMGLPPAVETLRAALAEQQRRHEEELARLEKVHEECSHNQRLNIAVSVLTLASRVEAGCTNHFDELTIAAANSVLWRFLGDSPATLSTGCK